MKKCAKFSIRICPSCTSKRENKGSITDPRENASLNTTKIHHKSVLYPDLPHITQ